MQQLCSKTPKNYRFATQKDPNMVFELTKQKISDTVGFCSSRSLEGFLYFILDVTLITLMVYLLFHKLIQVMLFRYHL